VKLQPGVVIAATVIRNVVAYPFKKPSGWVIGFRV
jgi:hypothetical protein